MIFPCDICDHLEGTVCTADELQRDAADIPVCPCSGPFKGKPDMGCWVVEQPDGLFCYYDATAGRIEAGDMTMEDVILYREKVCGIPYELARRDTLLQVESRPMRWEDIRK